MDWCIIALPAFQCKHGRTLLNKTGRMEVAQSRNAGAMDGREPADRSFGSAFTESQL